MGNEEGGERRGSAAERSFHLTMRCSGWCEVWGVGCGVWGVGCEAGRRMRVEVGRAAQQIYCLLVLSKRPLVRGISLQQVGAEDGFYSQPLTHIYILNHIYIYIYVYSTLDPYIYTQP